MLADSGRRKDGSAQLDVGTGLAGGEVTGEEPIECLFRGGD